MDQNRLNQQSNYWEGNFFSKPKMFGLDPSIAAISSLKKFKDENIDEIVELGAGLGRDTIFFAENTDSFVRNSITWIKKLFMLGWKKP